MSVHMVKKLTNFHFSMTVFKLLIVFFLLIALLTGSMNIVMLIEIWITLLIAAELYLYHKASFIKYNEEKTNFWT